MSSAPTPQEIAADASWLAQALDVNAGLVRLVHMTAGDYRAASFLDDRLLQAPVAQQVVAWDAAVSSLRTGNDAGWIFHIGHVGSTLLSRLLGELPNTLAVREPRLLRDLALAGPLAAPYIPAARQLMARTFAPMDKAVVKATSFASELAAELIADGRAAFVFASPRAYLGTILAGENSLIELATLVPVRRQRMHGRVALPDHPDRPAFNAAAAWACEMTALEAAAERLPASAILWLDFDDLLANMADRLRSAAEFLGLEAGNQRIAEIVNGPLMTRYSKALEYEYTPALRAELIAEASAAHAADIAAALAMLTAAAQDSPLLARALARSRPER
jgi:hypothetical protein